MKRKQIARRMTTYVIVAAILLFVGFFYSQDQWYLMPLSTLWFEFIFMIIFLVLGIRGKNQIVRSKEAPYIIALLIMASGMELLLVFLAFQDPSIFAFFQFFFLPPFILGWLYIQEIRRSGYPVAEPKSPHLSPRENKIRYLELLKEQGQLSADEYQNLVNKMTPPEKK